MNKIITMIMVIFMVLGAVDKAFLKNRLGYGEQLADGIGETGPLILSMAGLMCAAPEYISQVIIAKLVSGAAAIWIASLLTN